MRFMLFLIAPFLLLSACDQNAVKQHPLNDWIENTATPAYDFEVVNVYAHNPHAFTEGFIYQDGAIYESDGLYSQSKLKKFDLESGKILQHISLPDKYFAEGITIIGNHLYQLTYQSQTGFVYDKNTFQVENSFHYPSEGWGLTTDGNELIMSDGSSTLSFIDPQTFKVTHTVSVKDHKQPINHLNELEYINGKIYANIFPTDIIAIISPTDGVITGWINIQKLNPCPECEGADQCSNGIAYDAQNQTILVTGKNWPHIYAIRLKKGEYTNSNPDLPSNS
jgi:glutamine cyclotransferase